MHDIDSLVSKFASYVSLPWDPAVAPQQRIWFIVYPPTLERGIRLRLPAFEAAARSAGRNWIALDLEDALATWLGGHEYREAYFSNPDALQPSLRRFRDYLLEQIRTRLNAEDADEHTVVALAGCGSLFGVARLSEVLHGVTARQLPEGRLAVFFPGEKLGQRYKLLGVGDGWDYLAIPIMLNDDER